MTRTRRTRPELTESWDDVDDTYELDEEEYYEEEDRVGRLGARHDQEYFTNGDERESARKRVTRSSIEPELVMPASPDGGVRKTLRTNTPHLRLNQRSTTSDAGDLDMGRIRPRDQTRRFRMNERSTTSDAGDFDAARIQPRTQTQRFRMNERSMTSDAGSMGRQQTRLREVDYRDGEDEDMFSRYMALFWEWALRPTVAFMTDVMGRVLHNAKPLISFFVLAYIVGAALVFGYGFLNNTINNALTPICRIPGVTYLFDLPFCTARHVAQVEGTAEFGKLVQAQSAFDEVLAAASNGASLPMDMKRSEAGIRDLKHVVHYSTLPSKNELVFEFNGFIDTARQASQDLSRFNARIGRAVDHILSTNRWTLSIIDGVAAKDASRGSIGKFFSDHLNIFAPFQPISLSRDVLVDQYLRHTSAVEEQIVDLITEAQALLGVLENLDGRLDVIAQISTRDGLRTQDSRDELFAYLWTKLGGNKSTVKRFNQQLQLLQQVGEYRRLAWAHITTTMMKLQDIRNELENLRERVAMPETVGTDKVPLEVHIQAINLGIERLEQQRDESRTLEKENYRRIVGQAEKVEGRYIGDSEL